MEPSEIERFTALYSLATDKERRSFIYAKNRLDRRHIRSLAEGLGIETYRKSLYAIVIDLVNHFKEPTFECVGCGGLTEAEGLRWKKLEDGEPVTISHDRSALPEALQSLTDKQIYEGAFKPWETEVVKFKLLTKGKGDCHIQWREVDGVGGTLEFVWQPSGDVEFMDKGSDLVGDMTMDVSERWTVTSAIEVIKHGAGHVLGIGHTKSSNDVMWPYASSRVKALSKNDLAERDKRYPFQSA